MPNITEHGSESDALCVEEKEELTLLVKGKVGRDESMIPDTQRTTFRAEKS